MSVTTTNFAYALKTLYPQSRVQDLVYKDHPLLAMVPKDKEFYGANMAMAVRYANPQGRSAAFSTAQTNVGNNKGVQFLLTRVSDYQVVRLTTEAIQAAEKDMGALIKALDTEMQAGINNISASLAQSLYGDGTGAKGQSNSAASPITLVNSNDITNFEVGMVIVAASTTTGSLRSGSGTITAIDRDAGTITYTGTITSLTANDYLFTQGDAPNGGANVKVSGLAAWIPSSAPSSTAFFGVDRTPDVTRLGGLRVDVSALTPEEGLVTTLSKVAREGGRTSHWMCNHLFYRSIENALGAKVVYETAGMGTVSFTGLKVIGPKGSVMVYADQDCPSAHSFALQMDTWKLASLKEAPQILDLDGNQLDRVYNADEFEARIVYYAQLGCDAPGFNANVTNPS